MGKTIEQLESELLTVTDKIGGLMDIINGKGLVPAFRCGHSGLLFDGDYLKEWGRKYGVGLGPTPVSEVLDSRYDCAPPKLTAQIRSLDQIMHPLGHTFAQVDMLLVRPEELTGDKAAVTMASDPYVQRRARIVLAKQLVNPKSRIPMLRNALALKGVTR